MAKLLSGTRIYGTGTVDTQLFVNGTTESNSTDTGALIVAGGLGVRKNLYVGGTIYGVITSATNVLGGVVNTLSAGTDTAVTTTTGQVLVYSTATLDSITGRNPNLSNALHITNLTNANGTDSGALTVAGGVGIGGSLYVGQDAYINGQQVVTTASINQFANQTSLTAGTDTAVSTSTGAITIWNTSNLQSVTDRGFTTTNKINISNTSASFSTTTGALSVAGGAGIQKNLYVGGTVVAQGYDLLAYDGNVHYVSDEIGSDSNDGHRHVSAYRTIKYALSQAQSGDTVYIEPGTYYEQFPITIPQGVAVRGAGLREVTVYPTTATNTQSAFLLNGETSISDFTVTGFYKPGYAFKFAPGAKITSRSPYIERFSVITRGTTITANDPYGYDSGNAGNGAYIDAGVLDPTSLEPAMLWNEATFIVPNATGMYMTNGARAELLNGFVYFASKAIHAVAGTSGYGGVGKTRLKLSGVTGNFVTGDTIVYKDSTGTVLASGTIASTASGYIYLNGPVWGFKTAVDASTSTQNVYSTGVSPSSATSIILADYHQFGAELRCIGSAAVFGNQGVIADGTGTDLKLIAFNLSAIGSGKDLSDDFSLTVQSNEIIQLNDGKIYYQTVDQYGDFRVGDHFLVNQRTGDVSFNSATINLSNLSSLVISDGINSTTLTPGNIVVGNLNFAGNTISSQAGNITIDPAGSLTTINSDLQVNGSANITQLSYILGAEIVTTATIGNAIGGGQQISGQVNITNTSSNAFVVAGGGSVGGNFTIGGSLTVNGTVTYLNSNEIDIGNKVIWLSTFTNSAALSAGSGIKIGQPPGTGTTWAEWTFDGGTPGNWQSANGIVPLSTGLNLGLVGTPWNSLYINSITSLKSDYSTSTVSGNSLQFANGGAGVKYLYVDNEAWLSGSKILNVSTLSNYAVTNLVAGTDTVVTNNIGTATVYVTSNLQSVTARGATTNRIISITTATQSYSTDTGALQVTGGVGIGGNIYTAGTLTVDNGTDAGGLNGGALTVTGGAGIGGKLEVGGQSSISVNSPLTYPSITYSLKLDNIGGNTSALLLSNTSNKNVTVANHNGVLKIIVDGAETMTMSPTVMTITPTTSAGSTITGALVVAGGVGIGGNLYAGNIYSNGNQVLTSGGGGSGGYVSSLIAGTDTAINTSTGAITIWNTSNLQTVTDRGASTNNVLTITNNTNATTTASAALVVTGGLGVGKDVRIGGTLYVTTDAYVNGQLVVTTASINQYANQTIITAGTDTAVNTSTGNITIWNTSTFQSITSRGNSTNNAISITNTTAATSTQTGALVIAGGVGIGGDLYVGNNAFVAGSQVVTTSTINNYANQTVIFAGTDTAVNTSTGAITIWNTSTLQSITNRGATTNNAINITNNANSLATNSGALVIAGGVGIGRDLRATAIYDSGNRVVTSVVPTGVNAIAIGDLVSNGTQTSFSIINLGTTSTQGSTYIGVSANTGTVTITNLGVQTLTAGTDTVVTRNTGSVTVYNVSTLQTITNRGSTTNNAVTITNANASTTTVSANALYVQGGVGIGTSLYVTGKAVFSDDVTFTGATTYVYSTNTVYTDNVIELHTPSNSATWTVNDGKDIGLRFHYFNSQDDNAFLGRANDTGYLEWYGSGAESATGTFVGASYGTMKAGQLILANAVASTSTTSGALQVVGGVGIQGDLWVGGTLHATIAGSITTATNLAGGGPGQIPFQLNTGTTSFSSNLTYAGGTLSVLNTTPSISTTTGALIVSGGVGVRGDIYVGGGMTVTNTLRIASNTEGGPSSGALMVSGGATIGGDLWLGGSRLVGPFVRAEIKSFEVTGVSTVTNLTDATSTSTGALQVRGGVGVGGTLYATTTRATSVYGDNIYGTAVYDNNNRVVTSVVPSGSAYIGIGSLVSVGTQTSFTINNLGVQTLTAGTDTVVTGSTGTITVYNNSTLQTITNRGATTNNAISITNTSAATTTASGALSISGGLGVGGSVYAGAIYDNYNRVVTRVIPSGSTYINISNLVSAGTATSFTISNVGVTNVNGSTYIGVDANTGTVTITNLGVQTLTAGTDTRVSSSTGTVTVWDVSTLQTVTGRGASTNIQTTFNNGVIIGSTANNPLYFNGTYSNPNGTFIVASGGTSSPSSPVVNFIDGQYTLTPSTATVTTYYGNSIIPVLNNTVAYTNMYGQYSRIDFGASAAGTVANWYGFISANPTKNAAATTAVTNHVGFLAQDPTNITSTNVSGYQSQISAGSGRYNIYASGSAQNYFAGNVGVGVSTPLYPLDVSGGARLTGILTITNVTSATSTVSGALQVSGGVGIGKDLYVGGVIYGALAGSVSSATTILVTNDVVSTTTHYITFVANTGSYQSIKTDGPNGLTFIPSSGFHGIGTATPIAALDVVGGVKISGLTTVTNNLYATALYDNSNRVVTSVTPTGGSAIGIASLTSTGPSTSFTINNLGVHSISVGSGLSASASTGTITMTNTGVLSAIGTTYIGVSGATGNVTFTNLGVQTLTAGTDTRVSSSTGTVTVWDESTLQSVTGRGATTNNAISITNATQASATNTAALTVVGGVGIGKHLYVGGNTYLSGDLYVDGTSYTLSSANIETGNKELFLSTGSVTAIAAVGAGIAIGPSSGPYATLLFDGVNAWQSTGHFNPGATTTYDLGSSAATWRYLYVNTATVASATVSGNLTLSSGTANGVVYLNASKVATSGNALQFDGTNLLVGYTTAQTNGILQVNGGIGIAANSTVRQATNGDGGTLKFYGTQFVAGQTNSGSYGYTGGAGIASVSPSAGYVTLDVGGQTTGISHRLKVVNDGTGITGYLYYGQEGGTTATLYANVATNKVGIGTTNPAYALEVNGSFAATTKSFVIDHPTKPGMRLRYGSLEGPENGVYVRGRLKGTNTIELPDYWTKLVDPNSITVDITPIGKHQKLFVEDIIDNKVIIGNGNLFSKDINCFYTVWAERCDVEKLETEIQK